jgi:putative FmdB family regulatory protein
MYYDYMCTECKHEWEEEQKITDDALKKCPACKKEAAKRLISGAPAFVLAGGGVGWGRNGYSK